MSILRELTGIYRVKKANPFHGADGRFTSASGRGSSKAVYVSTGDKFKTAINNAKELKKSRSEKAKQLIESRAANRKPKEYREDNSEKALSEIDRLKKLGERRRKEARSWGTDENLKRQAKYLYKTGKDQWGYQDEWNNDPRKQNSSNLWYKSVGKSIARNERKTGNKYGLSADEKNLKFTDRFNKDFAHNVWGGENPNLLTNEQIKQHGSKAKAARANLDEYNKRVVPHMREQNDRDKKRSEATAKRLGRAYKSELAMQVIRKYQGY